VGRKPGRERDLIQARQWQDPPFREAPRLTGLSACSGGQWVLQGARIGKITHALRVGWDYTQAALALPLTETFPTEQEKRAVAALVKPSE